MIANPQEKATLQRSTADPAARPVSGEGTQPLLYDPRAVAAGDNTVTTFEVLGSEQRGDTLMVTMRAYYNGVPAARSGEMPFVMDDGEWRIDRNWVCALTQPPEGHAPQSGCE